MGARQKITEVQTGFVTSRVARVWQMLTGLLAAIFFFPVFGQTLSRSTLLSWEHEVLFKQRQLLVWLPHTQVRRLGK